VPTVRQLEYLVAIAEVKHFRKAAVRVNTTQPTLSGQLKALEDRLAVQLVERSRSRVALTPAGVEIVDIARRVLRDVREIRAIGSSHNQKLAGIVRLGVPNSIGPSLVPRFAQDLRREYPDLKFHIREVNPLELADGLADGTYDLAIGPLPLSGGGSFEALELYDEPLQLLVPSNHALAKRADISAVDLRDIGILTLDPYHPLTVMVRHFCQANDVRILDDYAGNSLDTLREMVATGLGAAFSPALYNRSQLTKDKTVKVLDVRGRPLVRRVGIAWRRSGAHSARFASLATFLKETSARVVGPL
jgi:LysR family transcriptional regulator, hydrogen peroxide-inducible genes activator